MKTKTLSALLRIAQVSLIAGLSSGIGIFILFLIGEDVLRHNIHYIGTSFAMTIIIAVVIQILMQFKLTLLSDFELWTPLVLGLLIGVFYYGLIIGRISGDPDTAMFIFAIGSFIAGYRAFGSGVLFTLSFVGSFSASIGYMNVGKVELVLCGGAALIGSFVHLLIWLFFTKAPESLREQSKTQNA